jgi:hypothetical protein
VRLGGCVSVAAAAAGGAAPIEAVGVVESLSPQVDAELRILFAEARLAAPTDPARRLQPGQAVDVATRPCGRP